MTSFPETLARALRTNPGGPFVTFYDEASGERQELSTTTYANWVAKASGLLVDEHGLERGDTIRIDLPTHWLAAVFLGAAWNTGLVVTDSDGSGSSGPDAVVCGPETLPAWADDAGKRPTLACSLLPFGVRFADPLPQGVHDVGIEVWGQPDAFTPFDPPAADDTATSWAGIETSHADLFGGGKADRLLSTVPSASPAGAELLAALLAGGGSLVLATHAADDRLAALAEAERAQPNWS
ncbi:TIGR03089 family protein [Nocardioides sp. NPDC057577]|uniref:TIGR03089 family protein n=1 Tax=Nocardioides sp. NPDC057577 TaxID=3346171 RepID=UPI00366EAE28